MDKLRGRRIYGGKARAPALVSKEPVSFFGGVDPDTGVIVEKEHPLAGECISGRVLVFPKGKGSTVGSYTLYRLKKNGKAPAAIVTRECETIVAVGAIISEIPCLDQIDIDRVQSSMVVLADADEGTLTLTEP